MRKIFFGLTTALALSALAVPTVAYAQHHGGGGGGGGGGHASSGISGGGGGGGGGMRAGNFGGGGGGGMRAGNFGGGGNFNAARGFSSNRAVGNVSGRNFTAGNFTRGNPAIRNNFAGRNFVNTRGTRNFARVDNGRRWAGNGRHHRNHRGWSPGIIGAYGTYAAYDYCWNRVWTPYGYERVYVCGPEPYGYY